ncbi:MAG: EAL domain-containing protein, partial [Pseudomonadota bacterium]
MRIRTILVLAFLFATLFPATIFGIWSYRDGVERELSEVKDRHLLIAQNLGTALERYHTDVTATFESIAESLLKGQRVPRLGHLMEKLHLASIKIVDEETGRVTARSDRSGDKMGGFLAEPLLEVARAIAQTHTTVYSGVVEGPSGHNEILAVRRYGNKLAVARIETNYFVDTARAVSFGERGYAAIVDHKGQVLAHPNTDWIATRRDLSEASSVRRLMKGDTGIESFYAPTLNETVIAGLTTVRGPGWGVMVPQPMSEIYAKARKSGWSLIVVLTAALSIVLLFVLALIRSLATPLEDLVTEMNRNAKKRRLKKSGLRLGWISIRELSTLQKSYNAMVHTVSETSRRVEALAYRDTVTGLPNRERFQTIVSETLENDNGRGGILVVVDIDNFKEINDIHGHATGDEFLRDCARKLTAVARRFARGDDGYTVARIGGDEFTLLLPGLTGDAEARAFLDALREDLSKPSSDMSFLLACGASIGCARYPRDAMSSDDLFKRADIAMFEAKKAGKNKAEIFDPKTGTQTAAEWRRDVLTAIDNNELVLHYQPKICAGRRAPSGVEALVRWNHPTRGFLSPGIWLPAIVNSPVMGKLGEWVINQALHDQSRWNAAGHDLKVAVNIGSRHFVASGFVDRLEEIRAVHDTDPACLQIEITEDTLFNSEERAETVMVRLHELGYSISIDDFGKGFSNMARLARLPVDFLKIDRSIVVGGLTNPRIRALFQSIVDMAAALECRTVAEGVETLEQAEFASQMGSTILQGYYFAKGMSFDELMEWLDQAGSNPVAAYRSSLRA